MSARPPADYIDPMICIAISLAAYQAIARPFWRRIELKLSVRCSMRSPPPATERVMADSLVHRPNERPTARLVSVVVAALVLTGCNANQAINPSGQADRCANDASCDPYDPISYAQNNTGNRGGGGR
jgi:hypothetical protein